MRLPEVDQNGWRQQSDAAAPCSVSFLAKVRSLLWFPLLFAVAVSLLVYLPRELWHASWPTVQGTVVRSKKVWHVTTPSNQKGFYQARVSYTYNIDGRQYEGNDYDHDGPYGGPWFGNEARVESVLDEYPVGREVTVHYRASDPSVAVLAPHPSWQMWVYAMVGNFLIGLILSLNWRAFRRWRKSRVDA